MSNSIPVDKRMRPDQLRNELITAGYGSKVLNVKGTGDDDGVATTGVIVHNGALTHAEADPVIAAHTPHKSLDEILWGAKADAILAATPGTLTNAQRDRVLQYLIKRARGVAEDID